MATKVNIKTIAEEPLTLHPVRAPWYGLLALGFVGTIVLAVAETICYRNYPADGPPPSPILYLYFLALFSELPLAVLAWTFYSFVRLDRDGITWRTGIRTFRSTWEDVSDYYLTAHNIDTQATTLVTSAGMLRLIPVQWNVEIVKAYVIHYAQSARASDWRLLGTRPEIDWPMRLGYDSTRSRFIRQFLQPLLWTWIAGTVAFGIWSMAGQYSKDGPSLIVIDILQDLMLFVGINAIPCVCLLIIPSIRDREWITVRSDGLEYEDVQRSFFTTWEVLADLNPDGMRKHEKRIVPSYTLNTTGGIVTITREIEKFCALKHILEERCR